MRSIIIAAIGTAALVSTPGLTQHASLCIRADFRNGSKAEAQAKVFRACQRCAETGLPVANASRPRARSR
jgi:hypothetical protein